MLSVETYIIIIIHFFNMFVKERIALLSWCVLFWQEDCVFFFSLFPLSVNCPAWHIFNRKFVWRNIWKFDGYWNFFSIQNVERKFPRMDCYKIPDRSWLWGHCNKDVQVLKEDFQEVKKHDLCKYKDSTWQRFCSTHN